MRHIKWLLTENKLKKDRSRHGHTFAINSIIFACSSFGISTSWSTLNLKLYLCDQPRVNLWHIVWQTGYPKPIRFEEPAIGPASTTRNSIISRTCNCLANLSFSVRSSQRQIYHQFASDKLSYYYRGDCTKDILNWLRQALVCEILYHFCLLKLWDINKLEYMRARM